MREVPSIVNRWRVRYWPSVKDGSASLRAENKEAPPVHPGPVAGFARPLQEKHDEQDSQETVD